MKLKKLLESVSEYQIYERIDKEVEGVNDDSRKINRDYLFVAVKGLKEDGHKFIDEAVKKGAVAVVGQMNRGDLRLKKAITYIKVADSRRALGLIASSFYGSPSEKLKVIGVTGTDGKTTTATLIYWILKESGKKVGLITSVGAKIGRQDYDTGFHVTNPEPLPLQKFLKEMVDEGCEFAVIEVTSHGLDQERIAGVNFDCAVLTNITHEHLDYHKSFEAYRDTKTKLFKMAKSVPVLNKDDSSFEYISSNLPEGVKVISYSSSKKDASLFAQNIKQEDESTTFEVVDGVNSYTLETKLLGEYNVSNVLAAIAVSRFYGVEIKDVKRSVSTFEAPKGRLQKIDMGQDFGVYVDFAHTPNSLEQVLLFLRGKLKGKNEGGRLISVFGCAGERDIDKRALMGEISAKIADISIFTAEDPRSEKVEDIIRQMVIGAKRAKAEEVKDYSNLIRRDESIHRDNKTHYVRISEREEAIAFALQKVANKDDIVVICGKGHEKSMAYDSIEQPWSDQGAIENAISADKQKTVVVLAGGKSVRMNSELPKVLHKIAGRPLLAFSLERLRKAKFGKIIVVVGHKKGLVMDAIGPAVEYAVQRRQLGTANALSPALKLVPSKVDSILVINGDDSAFYQPETLNEVFESHKKHKADLTFVTYVTDDPTGLGRVIRERDKVRKIVEEKEASSKVKRIKEVNINFFVFNTSWLRKNIKYVKINTSGEYYIVDLVGLAISQGRKVNVFKLKNKDEWVGVNTPKELKIADEKMRKKLDASMP